MAELSLFEKLCAVREQRVPVVLRFSRFATDPGSGRRVPVPIEELEAVKFEIRALTPDELAAADAVLLEAVPPERFIEKPNTGGPGYYKEPAGRDHDDPEYIRQRDKLVPLRQAMVCLAGCPDLMESIPGEGIKEKAATLTARIPAMHLDQLVSAIEDLGVFGAVGADDVDAFFRSGFGQSQKQPNGSGRNPAGGRRKRSSGSTEPTSSSGDGKPPASGA